MKNRAIALIVHGLAEHLACYEPLACRLASEKILAFGHDHGTLIFLVSHVIHLVGECGFLLVFYAFLHRLFLSAKVAIENFIFQRLRLIMGLR